MTKDNFLELQESHRTSGLTLKRYLQQIGLSYSFIVRTHHGASLLCKYKERLITMAK